VVHLRLVIPSEDLEAVCDILKRTRAVTNVIVLPGAAREPVGDVVLCDVAREDASVVLNDLRRLGIPERGSIAIERVDTAVSRVADEAEEAAAGSPADAVIWEDVEARTSEESSLSWVYLTFMALAALIAAVAILQDSDVLLVGAMVVGPEFGPIAGFCVAAVQRRRGLAIRSFLAVAAGFPVAMLAAFLATVFLRTIGEAPEEFERNGHALAFAISHPDALAFFVAVCAGIAGVLSLTTAKSGALIGVAVSLTTIPAAANVGVAASYGDWNAWAGSQGQLAVNLGGILVAGIATLQVQRSLYLRRRSRHLADLERTAGPDVVEAGDSA